jgi:hypothetical protein
MLQQHWDHSARRVLESFVEKSPRAYKAGLNWRLKLEDLIISAGAWRGHKSTLRYKKWWNSLLPIDGSPVDRLAKNLCAYDPGATSVPEFDRELIKFIEDTQSKMEEKCKSNPKKYDDELNGPFGIFAWLCNEAQWEKCGLTKANLSNWLKDWESTGTLGTREVERFRNLWPEK